MTTLFIHGITSWIAREPVCSDETYIMSISIDVLDPLWQQSSCMIEKLTKSQGTTPRWPYQPPRLHSPHSTYHGCLFFLLQERRVPRKGASTSQIWTSRQGRNNGAVHGQGRGCCRGSRSRPAALPGSNRPRFPKLVGFGPPESRKRKRTFAVFAQEGAGCYPG